MAEKPTDEEIARVEAWKAERNRASHEAYRARLAEREVQARSDLAKQIVGRTIVDVGGDLSDGEDWQKLVLALDDGASTLTIQMVGWDEKKLGITYDSSHKENTHG